MEENQNQSIQENENAAGQGASGQPGSLTEKETAAENNVPAANTGSTNTEPENTQPETGAVPGGASREGTYQQCHMPPNGPQMNMGAAPQGGIPQGGMPQGGMPQGGMPQGGMPQWNNTPYMQQGGFQAPPAEPAKKKTGAFAGIMIGIILLAVALVGIGIWLVFGLVAKSPQSRLAKGFQNWSEETAAYSNLAGKEVGWDTIAENLKSKATTQNISLNVTLPELSGITVGIDIDSDSDIPNRMSDTDISASVANIELLSGRVITDQNDLYIAAPDLMEETLKIGMESLGRDFNASVWSDFFQTELDENLSFNFEETEEESLTFSEEFALNLTADVKELYQKMTIEAADTYMEKEYGGRKVKCQGFEVVLPAEELNRILEHIQEEFEEGNGRQIVAQILGSSQTAEVDEFLEIIVLFFDVRYASDVKLMIYLDGKDRIVHLATPETIRFENTDIEFGLSLDFNGSKRTLDEVVGMVKFLASDGSSLTVDFTRHALLEGEDYTNKVELSMNNYDAYLEWEEEVNMEYTNIWKGDEKAVQIEAAIYDDMNDARLKLEGNFSDIVPGESLVFDLYSFNLTYNDDALLKLTGSYSVGPLEKAIAIPEDAAELLSMDELEATGLIIELDANLNSLMNKLMY